MQQQLGLLPQGWFDDTLPGSSDSNPIFHSDIVLGPAGPNWIAVEIEDRYDALEPVIRSYVAGAIRVYFPYPSPLVPASAPRGPAMMMTFDRAGLDRATTSVAARGGSTDSLPAPPRAADR